MPWGWATEPCPVAAHVPELGAERLAPQHRVALVAGMAEIERVLQRRDVLGDEVLVAAIAVAGQHQRIAADAVLAAVGAGDDEAADAAVRRRDEGGDARLGDDVDLRRLGRRAQAGRSARRRSARRGRASRAGGVAGIGEVGDDGEGEAVALGQPVDGGGCALGHRREDGGVGVAVRLLLDVGGEGRHAVGDAGGALGGCAGRGDEAGRERRGALGQRIALEDDGRDARFLRGEGGAEARAPPPTMATGTVRSKGRSSVRMRDMRTSSGIGQRMLRPLTFPLRIGERGNSVALPDTTVMRGMAVGT